MIFHWAKVRMFLAIFATAASVAQAENVDLSTVPARQGVQLTIYNSEDLTLVRETRKVSFKPGANPLQFSWANTLIDPTSVQLRFLTHPDKLDLLDTTFPHDKPQMLYWNVQATWTARRWSRSPTSPAGSVGRRITCAWPTRPRPRWASRASSGYSTTLAKSTRTPRCGWSSGGSIWSRRSRSWRGSGLTTFPRWERTKQARIAIPRPS